MSKRRVVVTGLGLLSPLANTVAASWSAILAGHSGISRVQHFDASAFSSQISGSIKDFDPAPVLSGKALRRADVFIQYGLVAAEQAYQDAGLSVEQFESARAGVAVGSGIGGLASIEQTSLKLDAEGPRKISPFFIPAAIINLLPGQISIRHRLRGPNVSIVTACATGNHNIGYGYQQIRSGVADIMFTGGAEMATTPAGLGGFAAMRALSSRNDAPQQASRPWDKDRDGFVLADGAGILVLEEYEHAKRRGARIYAEVVGFGATADAYHMTLPDENGEGGARAMQLALADAELPPAAVDYINAHATSTPAGDILEVRAIKQTFRQHVNKLAVSSTKSMTGHLLGATGAVEAIFSVLALRDNQLPPTINLDQPDAECDLDFVPHQARAQEIEVVLSNSFGFGGTNSSIIFKKIAA